MPFVPHSPRRYPRWHRVLTMALCVVILTAGSALSVPAFAPVAHAQSKDSADDDKKGPAKQAKKHFRQGQRMFAMGRFREALASYEKAHSLSQYPDILFNMAQCYRNLGDFESAIFHFRLYLKQKPDAENRDAVLELMEKLEEEMEMADRERDKEKREKPRRKTRKPVKNTPERPPEQDRGSPFYGKWWFWFGVAAVAGGTGVFFVFNNRESGTPDSALGNIDFP